jgi:hypothetical protein
MNSGLSTKNAPSASVVLPHYIYGAIAFFVAAIMMYFSAGNLVSSFIGPQLLGLTHMLILGWITMIIFGALYQLIPVVMEVKLYSENMTYVSFAGLGIGNIILVSGFWQNYTSPTMFSIIGGSLIVLAVIVFVMNALLTAKTSPVKSTENNFIIASIFWLFITVVFGLFILLNNSYQFISISPIDLLKAHASIGLIGWFMMLVMGVASTLLPMFFIVHNLNKKFINASFYTTNIGLILLVISILFNISFWFTFIAIITVFTGIFLFVRYNYDAYKRRLRKKLDIGMKLSVASFIMLAVSIFSGLMMLISPFFFSQLSIPFSIIFGFSLVLGFYTSLILGQMYKTLPFIVWLVKYQDKVGKFKTPLPADLYSEKVANAHYYTFIISSVLAITGILISNQLLIQLASVAYAITALLFLYNTLKIILHKENLKPLK